MKTIRFLIYFISIVALSANGFGQISVVNDSFNSTGNWAIGSTMTNVSQVFTNGTDISGGMSAGSSTVSLAIDTATNQRVDFTASLANQNPTPNVQAAIPLNFTAPYNSDWSISIAATNTFIAASGQSVQIGLIVSNTNGFTWSSTPPQTHDYVKLVLAENFANGLYIHGGLHLNGSPVSTNSITGISATTGSLVVSYTASTQVLTAGYNFNGTLLQFGSYGIAGSGGTTANTTWESPPSFTVSLYAQAGTSGSAYSLSAGTASLDNFVTSASTTAMTAIPEPSTYAALAGLGALGLACWRRQRRVALR